MLPLTEKTVVITLAREQSRELKNELERLGARVVLFPTVEIVAPESCGELDMAIENLSSYDWLIFTSASAVEHFLRRFERQNLETAELDTLLVCAVGAQTAERLRLAQIHLDVVPTDSRDETVYFQLSAYLGGSEHFQNVRFLLPRSQSQADREHLTGELRRNGALIDAPVAYQEILPPAPETGKLKALLQGGAIDCIAFANPLTFKNFRRIFAGENLPQMLETVTIACVGETTAQALVENGLKPSILTDDHAGAAFARLISQYFLSENQ